MILSGSTLTLKSEPFLSFKLKPHILFATGITLLGEPDIETTMYINISPTFSINSEAYASELIENVEMFSRYS